MENDFIIQNEPLRKQQTYSGCSFPPIILPLQVIHPVFSLLLVQVHPLRLGSALQTPKQSSSVYPLSSGFLPSSAPSASTHQPIVFSQSSKSFFGNEHNRQKNNNIFSLFVSINKAILTCNRVFYLTLTAQLTGFLTILLNEGISFAIFSRCKHTTVEINIMTS